MVEPKKALTPHGMDNVFDEIDVRHAFTLIGAMATAMSCLYNYEFFSQLGVSISKLLTVYDFFVAAFNLSTKIATIVALVYLSFIMGFSHNKMNRLLKLFMLTIFGQVAAIAQNDGSTSAVNILFFFLSVFIFMSEANLSTLFMASIGSTTIYGSYLAQHDAAAAIYGQSQPTLTIENDAYRYQLVTCIYNGVLYHKNKDVTVLFSPWSEVQNMSFPVGYTSIGPQIKFKNDLFDKDQHNPVVMTPIPSQRVSLQP